MISGEFDRNPPEVEDDFIHPTTLLTRVIIRALEDGLVDDREAIALQDIGRLELDKAREESTGQ